MVAFINTTNYSYFHHHHPPSSSSARRKNPPSRGPGVHSNRSVKEVLNHVSFQPQSISRIHPSFLSLLTKSHKQLKAASFFRYSLQRVWKLALNNNNNHHHHHHNHHHQEYTQPAKETPSDNNTTPRVT